MHFTPGQLRDIVGVSVEMYRHWKRVLPPFVDRKGYARCFSIGDLLAASILRRLTSNCGVRVGHLKAISKDIVRVCNSASWARLDGKVLVLDVPNGSCRLAKTQTEAGSADIVIVCPLAPILAELRDALVSSQPAAGRGRFPFPAIQMGSDSEAREGRA